MEFIRRLPPRAWGVVATIVIVALLFAFAPADSKKEPTVAPRKPEKVVASSDSPALVALKGSLNETLQRFIQAKFSRRPDRTVSDYLELMEPLVSKNYQGEFKSVLETPIEGEIRSQGVTVTVRPLSKPFGLLYRDGKNYVTEGMVKLLTVTQNAKGSVINRSTTEYEYELLKTPQEDWQVQYFIVTSD